MTADEVSKLLRQQAALAAFGSFAFRERDLQKILAEAARVCAEGLGAPFCKVCRYRPLENDLLIVAGFGWHEGIVGQVVSEANETSPQGRAFTTGKPVIIYDLTQAQNYDFPAFYGEHHIISSVDVLISRLDGTPFGVLEIDSAEQTTYDIHDINFLTGFANVLAEAVATGESNALLQRTIEAMEAAVAEKDRLIAERDVLAEELKHRVRNNLQLVYSMLSRHTKLPASPESQGSMHSIIRRVITLSEVYEQLLGTGLGRAIDLGAYLTALCASLPGLQSQQHDGIRILCDVQNIVVDLDTVTAIGMIAAEAIANSYDHAFPEGTGTVTIRLIQTPGTTAATLTIADTGIGFTEQPGSKRHGVGLVRRLAQQIDGTVTLNATNGTLWTLNFPIRPAPQDLPRSLT